MSLWVSLNRVQQGSSWILFCFIACVIAVSAESPPSLSIKHPQSVQSDTEARRSESVSESQTETETLKQALWRPQSNLEDHNTTSTPPPLHPPSSTDIQAHCTEQHPAPPHSQQSLQPSDTRRKEGVGKKSKLTLFIYCTRQFIQAELFFSFLFLVII